MNTRPENLRAIRTWLALVWAATAAPAPAAAKPSVQPETLKSAVLLDEADTIAKWNGASVSSEHIKSGKVSAKWADHPRHAVLSCADIPHDWSAYDTLTFWAYSEKATNAGIMLAINLGKPKKRRVGLLQCDDHGRLEGLEMLHVDLFPNASGPFAGRVEQDRPYCFPCGRMGAHASG